MDFNEYQKLAERTDNMNMAMNDLYLNACMGMVGESAETLEHMKKYMFQGHELSRDKLIEESGDTLWYIAKMARVCGITLEELAERNIEKLEKRYPEKKFKTERSINRLE